MTNALPTHHDVEMALNSFADDYGLTEIQARAYWIIVKQWVGERPDFKSWKASASGYIMPPARQRRTAVGTITAKSMKALERKGMVEEFYTRDANGKIARFWCLSEDDFLDPTPIMAAMRAFVASGYDVRGDDHYWNSLVSGSQAPGDGSRVHLYRY